MSWGGAGSLQRGEDLEARQGLPMVSWHKGAAEAALSQGPLPFTEIRAVHLSELCLYFVQLHPLQNELLRAL